MRTKPDAQHHHHPGVPGCHRCGLPLLESATFCPYCERSVNDGRLARIIRWRPARAATPRQPVVTETRVLAVGFVLFAIVAAAALVAALAI